jgi:hypothetical protein
LSGGEKSNERPEHLIRHHPVLDPGARRSACASSFRLNRESSGVELLQQRGARIRRCREERTGSARALEELSPATRF